MVNKMEKTESKEKSEKEKKSEKPAKDKTKEKKQKPAAKKSRLSGMKRLLKPEKKELQREETKPETAEEPFTILKFVLMTEKAIQLIEKENKLVFIVDRKCSKDDIKNAAESAFNASVDDVETMIDQKSRKKAFIRFKEPGTAGDIAMRLGII
jgi:ribosomal protein uL23